MPLATGTRLGPYEIESAIGAGGMGEVYRARDSRLNRDVALKILPGELALDPDRLARFKREAQVLASLSHPNIATIYGVEDADAAHALVLELVEGPTLAERLERGPLPLEEAIAVARQIADALEAAHGQGIVHRDLKPGNIKLKADGTIKVLDFGLAKTVSPAVSADAETRLTVVSQTGLIVGTVAYMSPEQARGADVDKRTDIWAFGVVFYEMLAGRHPFMASTRQDTLAAVIGKEPEGNRVPATPQ